MRWLHRPSILVVLLAALVVGAAVVVLWPWNGDNPPRPQPVTGNDREIVWLYSATSPSTWERFVTAVQTVAARLDLGLQVEASHAFPPETTAVPELALTVQGQKGRLLVRWYKLTSDWKAGKWVHALNERQPPPLAILGGSSSDPAIELANCLEEQRHADRDAPLLLLTTATADEGLARDNAVVPLTELYAGRTFRFCFTNRQMAEAVTDFVWGQESLRPDGDPCYLAGWRDDAYSMDLTARFIKALESRLIARNVTRFWGRQAGAATLGGLPIGLIGQPDRLSNLAVWEPIYCGVGTFNQPNRWEADVARRLMEQRRRDPAQRAVLVLPAAAAQPARRFLRGLMRTAPVQPQRFVVVTGDAIAFSTIYRDRNVAWPIQDLPFDLVFFCHRDPVDAQAGFRPEGDSAAATGTDDVLLFGDMVEALVQGSFAPGGLPSSADELSQRLRRARWRPAEGRVGYDESGPLLFDEQGNRRGGTGEHIVWLQPSLLQDRIQPQATITVWYLENLGGRWQPSREPLRVEYDEWLIGQSPEP